MLNRLLLQVQYSVGVSFTASIVLVGTLGALVTMPFTKFHTPDQKECAPASWPKGGGGAGRKNYELG